jgi:hypothetical protein
MRWTAKCKIFPLNPLRVPPLQCRFSRDSSWQPLRQPFFLYFKTTRMRTISYWAKCNIRQARVYIVLIHLILAALAWYMGSAFLSLHISFPRILLVLSVALFLVATVLYPGKSKKLYFRQKCCDVIIVASSFVMICCSGNRQGTPSGYAYGSSGEKGKNNLTRQEKRILRTEFKKELTV